MQRLPSADWWRREPHPPFGGYEAQPLWSIPRTVAPAAHGSPDHAPKEQQRWIVCMHSRAAPAHARRPRRRPGRRRRRRRFRRQLHGPDREPSNRFSAGTLSMSNSLDGAAILTASNMKPSETAERHRRHPEHRIARAARFRSAARRSTIPTAPIRCPRARPRGQGLRRLLERHADLRRGDPTSTRAPWRR